MRTDLLAAEGWLRAIMALALCTQLGAAIAASPVALAWEDLRPATAKAYDPFAALGDAQLEALSELVLSRTLASRGLASSAAATARRAELVARLTKDGLDVESLLKQRERLIAERRSAAETPVPSLQGRLVQITGYLIPAAATPRPHGVAEYLLVPSAGACSHTPAPPVNQIVRVRADAGALPYDALTLQSAGPLTITGTLLVQFQEQQLFLADGMVAVRSAYAIHRATISTH
jgi:uncharacterized protein